MRVLGYILFAIFCLVLMAGTFLYVAAPVGFVRDQIVAAVKRETGRDLIIRGETSFAFYPNLGVALEDVELSAPPGMGGAPLLKTALLKLDMPVLALLQSRVSIEQFILERPVINLRVDTGGRKSWSVDGTGAGNGAAVTGGDQPLSPELEEFIQNSTSSRRSASKSGSGLAALSLGDVRVIDGTFRYSDARDGTSETITGVNLKVGLDNLAAPLTLSGRAVWKGREIPVEATVASLAALLDDRPTDVTVAVAPKDLRLNFSGKIDPAGKTLAAGKLKLTMDDVPEIARWISGEAAAGPLRTVALNGTLQASTNAIRLGGTRFTINDLTGTANLLFGLTGQKKISGSLTVGDIKTASFLGGGATASDPVGKLSRSTPAGADGWSSTAIDFKPLRSIDADITVGFKSLAHNDIRIGAGKIRLALTGGIMRIDANPLAIYGGAARGTVIVNARRSIATYEARLAADRISALPLLKAAAGFDWLSGATKMQVSVAGRGLSQRQMIRTMSGTASFDFTDGAIEGLNVAKILRGVQQGQFNNFDRVAGEKTDFSELAATFRIERGIASNNDLRLLGPLVRASGVGSANLGRRTINYRLTPKLVASLQGQGGADVSGLSIPLKIQGPWANPQIAPDLENVLQNPESVAAAIDSIGQALGKSKKINSGKVKEVLDSVFGGSSGGKKKSPLGGLLGDFLQQQ